MEFLTILNGLSKDLPTIASVSLSIAALVMVAILHMRKVNIEEKTSSSGIHERQLTSLMAQIQLLSSELERTRGQLSELHHQNIELMRQLREANRRISDLENRLEHYRDPPSHPDTEAHLL